MIRVYIHGSEPMTNSQIADVNIYYLFDDKPDFILSVYEFIPSLHASLEKLEPDKIEIIDKEFTSFVWDNSKAKSEYSDEEFDRTEKLTPLTARLAIKSIFNIGNDHF